jgi:hypothetical protein
MSAAESHPLQADQQRVSGKRGKKLVRRIAESRRPERKHLPYRLSRLAQKIGEAVGFCTKVADAE